MSKRKDRAAKIDFHSLKTRRIAQKKTSYGERPKIKPLEKVLRAKKKKNASWQKEEKKEKKRTKALTTSVVSDRESKV